MDEGNEPLDFDALAAYAKKASTAGKLNGNGHDKFTRSATDGVAQLIPFSEMPLEPLLWLRKDWLCRKKLTLIGGMPGCGKTTILLDWMSTLSAGSYWPEGSKAPLGDCIFWSGEDTPSDTLKPRLMRMGGDLSRIHFVKATLRPGERSRAFDPSRDMPMLKAAIDKMPNPPVLIGLDPMIAVTGKADSHKNAETRNALAPFIEMVESLNACAVGIHHLSKGTAGKNPLERLTGSIAFGALPRIVCVCAERQDKDEDEAAYVIVRAKCNIGVNGGGYGYDIEAAPLIENPDIDATRIKWGDVLEGTAMEIMDDAEAKPEQETKQSQAEAFINSILADGRMKATEVIAAAIENGISKRTLERATSKMINIKKTNAQGAWWWQII